jgi:hypothetical protein
MERTEERMGRRGREGGSEGRYNLLGFITLYEVIFQMMEHPIK